MTIPNLLEILCNSKEFEEIPVRHNEDNLNEGLSKLVPHPVDPRTYDSPHTKTYLLIQAHLSKSPLPVRDYLTDTKIVLESSIRLLQAMLDISTEKGHLDTSIQLIQIQQMLYQGMWGNESSLQNLLDKDEIKKLYKIHKIKYLCELWQNETWLNDVKDQAKVRELWESIPNVDIRVRVSGFDGEEGQKLDRDEPLRPGGEVNLFYH